MRNPPPLAKKRRYWSRWLLPAALFLLLTAATLSAWLWQSRLQREAAELSDSQESAAVTADIRRQLRLHAQFLGSLQAFAATHPEQDLRIWRHYAEQIDAGGTLSGLFAFAYAPAVSRSDIEHFVFSMRQQVDRSNFRIIPEPREDLVAPVVFAAPETPELQPAIGFDILSDPTRRAAIHRAIDTRGIALSGPLVPISDAGNGRPAFLMAHALYRSGLALENASQRRQAFRGAVLALFRTDTFFSSLNLGDQNRLALQVFDESLSSEAGESSIPKLIYDSEPNLKAAPETSRLHHEIDFGGRNWILEFRPRNSEAKTWAFDLATFILIGGTLGNLLISLLIFQLSTHRERAEQYAEKVTRELREHRDRLHELVAERTARLEAALQRVIAANQAKSEFLANMSHELRTPMHAVLGFSQLGIERADSDGQAKLSQYFQRIEQSASRLLDLINELLDLSKLESGHTELLMQPTDMSVLLDQVIGQMESLLIQRQLKIEFVSLATDVELAIDPKRITQVIFNLLSNAIKFSPAHSLIRIELDVADLPLGRRAQDNGTQPALVIRFIDSGIGIPEEELESIFEKFEQSSTTRTGAGGTGLGLAISRAIVTQHRGTISAKNNLAGGACFTVTLPKDNGNRGDSA
ncbi:MAG: CHASE domain-containing protein [Betaproteobacteria bacterium]|nr:CHASE domain-containing protein [Betaproteobacteria bacterium]